MKKVKIFIIGLLCVLLCACGSDTGSDDAKWNLEAKYNMAYNDWSGFYSINETENGIVSYYHVNNAHGSNPQYFPLYIDGDTVSKLNDNVSSICSIENFENCDNLIPLSLGANASSVFYYKGKAYYFNGIFDDKWMYSDVYISSSDIDGSNQKDEYLLGTYGASTKSHHGAYIQFHNNKIYANYENELFIIDLNTDELNKAELPGVKDVWKIFLYDNTMYITSEEYDDGEKVHYNALLKCDLKGNIEKVEESNKIVLFIDDTLMYYAEEQEGGYGFYILNRKTNEVIDLQGVNYQYALKYKDQYLFDTGTLGFDSSKMMLLDKDLNVLCTKDYTNDEYWNETPLFIGDKYYVIKYLKTYKKEWYGYYEIKEDGISDLIEMVEIE